MLIEFQGMAINTPIYLADFEGSIFSSLNVKNIRGAVSRL